MNLPTYILFTKDGEDYILQAPFPHYIWKIVPEYREAFSIEFYKWHVAGYKILLAFAGSFHGNHVIYANNMKEQLHGELDKAASWYLAEVIGKDLEKFQRYAL